MGTSCGETMGEGAISEVFATGVRRFELGLYDNAQALFRQVLAAEPGHGEARYFLERARRRLAPRPVAAPTAIWQFDPAGAWEKDWLTSLLGDCVAGHVVDTTWTRVMDPMVVIDNRLVPEKIAYYRAAFEAGARFVLIHLSDEAFRDDRSLYRLAEATVRNYRSELLAADARVLTIPLGFKAGFAKPGFAAKPAAERRHLWSFAGDRKKLTRAAMMAAMQTLPGGAWHLTEGFGTADSLSTDAYRALLDDTLVVPCPGGWSNLETFRVYEALEAGCIPIVERRPGFDYFADLLGPHPIPTVMDWQEAPAMIRAWQSAGREEATRRACVAWWQDYKTRLAARVQAFVRAALT
jgi:hypothetical protein